MKNKLLGLVFLTFPLFAYSIDDLQSLPVKDRYQLFQEGSDHLGVARKTFNVLARPAIPGEIIVTVIRGEGEETRSKPAEKGDWVVKNLCEATGNEEILVKKAKFAQRYGEALTPPDNRNWQKFRPQGEPMDYLVITEKKPFAIVAPWGEKQRVMPGDILLRSQKDLQDSYRIQKVAFDCTYQIIKPAK